MSENPPAFPGQVQGVLHEGMSLRDWFAGQCLTRAWDEGETAAKVARAAYYMADAMLAERDKR